jgi:ADP-heptose:LPS heptosyltransferase
MSERGRSLLRNLDKTAGIPLSMVLGAIRPRSSRPPEDVSRIGVLMLGVIGDTLLASAIFEDLRRIYPAAVLVALISEGNRGTLDLLDAADEVVHVAVKKPVDAMRQVRKTGVDILIDIGQWARLSALLAGGSGARFTIGFRTAGQFRHYPFDATVPHSNQLHEIDNFRALLTPLGIQATGVPRLRDDLRAEVQRLGVNNQVILHPWASGFKSHLREWPEERWAELAVGLRREGYAVAISGGPSDRSRAQALAARLGSIDVEVLAGRLSLRDTAVALARSAGVVSVNTGIMHLAALVGAPLVGLHGPTNPLRWGPINSNAVVLGPGPEAGGAFLHLGFEYPDRPVDCMGMIAVEEVLSQALDVMQRPRDSQFSPLMEAGVAMGGEKFSPPPASVTLTA